jgi:hypothetical protein
MDNKRTSFIITNILFFVWMSVSGALLGYSIDTGDLMALLIPSVSSLLAAIIGWIVYIVHFLY